MHLRSSDEDSSSQDSDLLSVAGAMGEEESPSMEAVQADQPLPKRSPILGDSSLQFPFPELHGEVTVYVGRAENALIALSSYRLHIQFRESTVNVPLRLIDGVECRDVFQLHITCKDCKVIRCQFSSLEQCHEWLKRLASAVRPPSRLEELFCFAFHAWCLDVQAGEKGQSGELCGPGGHVTSRFWKEVERMGFDTKGAWRVTEINRKYRLCPSYPQLLVVPAHISDTELESVATFRSWKRFPAVVYRHCSTGAVIARCGQPEVSWWGWRNADDERLAQSIVEACALDRSSQEHLVNGSCNRDSSMSSASECVASQPPKLLILDARSYAAAVANRAKGGGCECPEYYSSCEVVFMGMANIHAIRRSFASLRLLCTQMPDPANWLSALEGTKWLQHLSVLLKAALLVVNAVDRDHRPVTVHCSDGWDRTPQIVALSKVLLDPYYRTIEGFQILVEMEWLDFGHKFADRCGHGPNSEDPNERCPVFLQWLDCVHQLLRQFPCSFQFNETFLVKLAQHTYSCLFGTFLCNSRHEREEHRIQERTCSVWSLLRPTNPAFLNVLYSTHSETVLLPVFHVRSLLLWSAVYLPSSSRKAPSDEACAASPEDGHLGRLPKMRSFDGLAGTCEAGVTSAQTRRSSDPSLQERQDHRRALEISVGVVKKGGGTLVWEGTATHSHGVELKMCQSEVQDGHLIAELSNAEEDKNGSIGGRTKWSGYNHNGEIELLMEVGVAKEQMEHFLQEASEDDDGRAGKIGGDTDVGHADHVSAPNSELLPDLSAEGVEELRDQLSNKLAMDLLEESVSQQTLGEPFRSNTSLMVNSPESEIEMDGPIEAPSDDPGVSDLCPVTPAEEPGDLASFSMISKKLVIQEAPDGPSVRALFSEAGDEDPRVAPPAVHSLDVGEPHSDAVQQQVMEEGYQLKAQALRTQMPVPDPESHFQPSCRLRCSTELLSEASWEKMGPQDTEATPWYPESSATPCYGCESRFWLTGRKHHCRAARPAEEAWNCGNVFCASCCAHKVSVQSQHLTEPSRVCGTCYGSLRLSTVPVVDLELEKPIAASSN